MKRVIAAGRIDTRDDRIIADVSLLVGDVAVNRYTARPRWWPGEDRQTRAGRRSALKHCFDVKETP